MNNRECEVKKDNFCWCCPDRGQCKEFKKEKNHENEFNKKNR